MNPLVSVVIPLYNKDRYVHEALRSVLMQTVQEFEVIVVDDGSTDTSIKRASEIKDTRIRLIRQVNAGAAAARNTGIMAAKGTWIAFLDADDRWLPHNLASHFKQLAQHPDLQWSAGLFNRRWRNDVTPMKVDRELLASQSDGNVIRDALILLSHSFLWTGAIIIKKSVFVEVGGMDQTLRTAEDLDMWLRIALIYPRIAYTMKPIADYSVDVPDSLTHQSINMPLNLPHFMFARKHLSNISDIAAERQDAVYKLIQGLVKIGIRRLLLAGYRFQALQIIEEFRFVLGHKSYAAHRRLAYIPATLLRAGFSVKQMLN